MEREISYIIHFSFKKQWCNQTKKVQTASNTTKCSLRFDVYADICYACRHSRSCDSVSMANNTAIRAWEHRDLINRDPCRHHAHVDVYHVCCTTMASISKENTGSENQLGYAITCGSAHALLEKPLCKCSWVVASITCCSLSLHRKKYYQHMLQSLHAWSCVTRTGTQ